MNSVSLPPGEPGVDQPNHPRQLNAVQFYLLSDAIQLIRELVALFRTLQRFRGASMAWAAGDLRFELTSVQLVEELARNRLILNLFRTTRNDLLPVVDWQRLNHGLDTIIRQNEARQHWENYDHKTELLEFIIGLIRRVAIGSNYFSVSQQTTKRCRAKQQVVSPKNERKLINLVFVETLQFTETMGRLRALATYANIVADPDPALIQQLINTDAAIYRQLDRFRRHAKDFQPYALKGIPSLVERQVNETRLLQLTRLVKEGIIDQGAEKPSSRHLFNLATEVIDVHLKIVYETLDYLAGKNQQHLHSWYQSG